MKLDLTDKKQAMRVLRANAKFEKSTGCWLWKGTPMHRYGSVTINGKPTPVHRVAYALWNGPIPKGLLIRHKCDVKPCFNPDHLIPGTHEQNMQDCRERIIPGTAAKNPNSTCLQLSINKKLLREIDVLVETGFYGGTRSGAAEKLIAEAIRHLKSSGEVSMLRFAKEAKVVKPSKAIRIKKILI